MIKQKILATEPLLTTAGLIGTGVLQPAEASTVEENPLVGKYVKDFHSSSSSVGNDFAAVLVTVGIILALGSTVCVVHKALNSSLNSSKPSSSTADSVRTGEEKRIPTTTENSTSASQQITPATYIEKAYTSWRQGDVQQAVAELNNAIRLHPHNAYLYTERAKFRRKNLGDKEGALEDYTQAIHLHPDNALFYLWRSQLYHEIGDMLKAMTDYNTAIRLAPDDTVYHFSPTSVNSLTR
ncbi:tetratricopeptide repeat protein [Scytonema sp. PCC 10023]|uniref:tetratricopeptide repeat protein n=1 Tax=Scytonema sp. PCC 10023 TaxID=1680591 RepID=UPI0039C68166